MNRKAFGKGMAYIMLASNANYDEDQQEVLYEIFENIEGDHFVQACLNISKSETNFYPGTNIIAMISRAAEKASGKLSGSEAWEKVIAASDNLPARNELNPTILRSFKALGFEWHTLVPGGGFALPPDKIGFMRRDFIKFYEQFSEAEKIGAVPQIESAGIIGELIGGIG